ncbi:MAG: amidase [Pseudomonadota bacterium]
MRLAQTELNSNALKLHNIPLALLVERLRARTLSSLVLTDHFLERIARLNTSLNAYMTVTADSARDQAERADWELVRGQDRGVLHGIPIALKDNIDTKGVRTTRGAWSFRDHVPDSDAAVVQRLTEAGAVVLGKTAMHEFAYGMNGINPHFGATRNPWNLDMDAGGSSSGSAAAVAAGLAIAALGTDTGGSVRQPAHSCGVVGFKPSFGTINQSGVYPLVPSMDHVGVIAQTVSDTRAVFEQLLEKSNTSSTTLVRDLIHGQVTACDLLNMRLGIDRIAFFEGDSRVVGAIDHALAALQNLGAELVPLKTVELTDALKDTRATFSEANSLLWPLFETDRDLFGKDVAAKVLQARHLTHQDYQDAQRRRASYRQAIEQAFLLCDVLALPTSTTAAAPINDRPKDHAHLAWRNCGLFNFTGHPAISIPAGRLGTGLPIGLMLVAPLGQDARLLAMASGIEAVLPSIGRAPEHE